MEGQDGTSNGWVDIGGKTKVPYSDAEYGIMYIRHGVKESVNVPASKLWIDDVVFSSTSANQPPVANAGQDQVVKEGIETTLSASGSYDPDGDTLIYNWSQMSGVTVILSDVHAQMPSFTAPEVRQNETLVFVLVVNDGNMDSAPDQVNIIISQVNKTPFADDQSVIVAEDSPVDITLTGIDQDGDTLTFEAGTGPEHGALSGTAPIESYTPDADYFGDDAFTFNVSDGNGGMDVGTVSITVTPINDHPSISDISDQTIDEDDATWAVGFSISDVETPAADLVVTVASDNQALVPNANIVLGGSGAGRAINITPAPDQNGAAGITVTVEDGDGSTATDTFTLTVEPRQIATIYVSETTGDDLNSGTEVSPVRTIQHGMDIALSGDTVKVLPGFYQENVVLTDVVLVIGDEADFENVVIDGTQAGVVLCGEDSLNQ